MSLAQKAKDYTCQFGDDFHWRHLEHVARLVSLTVHRHVDKSEAVAWLYNALLPPDAPDERYIRSEFGNWVADHVVELTAGAYEPPSYSEATIAGHKEYVAKEYARMENMSVLSKTVQLAAFIDLVGADVLNEVRTAPFFLGDVSYLLDALHAGDRVLWTHVHRLLLIAYPTVRPWRTVQLRKGSICKLWKYTNGYGLAAVQHPTMKNEVRSWHVQVVKYGDSEVIDFERLGQGRLAMPSSHPFLAYREIGVCLAQVELIDRGEV